MLTKRLRELTNRVPTCETVLDVGCDHGIVAYSLVKSGKVKKVLLSDISKNSLEKARKLIGDEFPESEFFVSDGVEKVESHFDFCIVAGMGGLEIAKIIDDKKIDHALLQPMNNIDVLRRKLIELGFAIVSDEIVFDDKFYNMIVVKRGIDELSQMEVVFGRTNLKNMSEDFVAYLNVEEKKNLEILKNVPKGERRDELVRYIALIKELLKI
ncbi:MAG: class I SAM-dependent methyltransferase [Clostridia bacterium]